ncbi:DUF6386 family protein [Paenibacillus sp. 8b26]|uniref:DUF6386 family protein n=1 Tax=Paenibacillus sp. 8b26 TaxID=3424133 RepID=UPI003D64B4C6
MNVASSPFQFTTDTATLCIFDTEALKHRLDDEPDWWSIEEDELGELNQGNVAFLIYSPFFNTEQRRQQ